jgi:hypothetical protein
MVLIVGPFNERIQRHLSSVFVNEEPAMRNLIIDGAAGGETKRRHDVTFPLLTLHRGKDRVHFSTGFFQHPAHIPRRSDVVHMMRASYVAQMRDKTRITRVVPGVRSALLSMGYFWSVLYMYMHHTDITKCIITIK